MQREQPVRLRTRREPESVRGPSGKKHRAGDQRDCRQHPWQRQPSPEPAEEEEHGHERQRDEPREFRQRGADREHHEKGDIQRRPAPRCPPRKIQAAENETRNAEVGRDERRMRRDVGFRNKKQQRDQCRPPPEPLHRPGKDEDAQQHAEQDDHEPRAIEQRVRVVVAIEEPVRKLERSGERDCVGSGRVNRAERRIVDADRQERNRRPHARERRVLDVDAKIRAREGRVSGREMAGLVERRGLAGVAEDGKPGEHDRERHQRDRDGRAPRWRPRHGQWTCRSQPDFSDRPPVYTSNLRRIRFIFHFR